MSDQTYAVPAAIAAHANVTAAQFQSMTDQATRDPQAFWAEQSKRIAWIKPPTQAMQDAIIAEIAAQVRAIRARGGEVVFVRSPSDPPLLDIENKRYPRAATWDSLLAATGAPGIYWADDPELARLHTVELSHLGKADRAPFTRRLVALIGEALTSRGGSAKLLGPLATDRQRTVAGPEPSTAR